jgi:hypothetical protein
VTANSRLLMSRHEAIVKKMGSAKNNLDSDSAKLRELESELRAHELLLLRMNKRHDELTRQENQFLIFNETCLVLYAL